MPKKERQFQWWPEKLSIPDGWKIADNLQGTHHNCGCSIEDRNYILIQKEDYEKDSQKSKD